MSRKVLTSSKGGLHSSGYLPTRHAFLRIHMNLHLFHRLYLRVPLWDDTPQLWVLEIATIYVVSIVEFLFLNGLNVRDLQFFSGRRLYNLCTAQLMAYQLRTVWVVGPVPLHSFAFGGSLFEFRNKSIFPVGALPFCLSSNPIDIATWIHEAGAFVTMPITKIEEGLLAATEDNLLHRQ